jgi:hypothetical protein
MNFMAVASCGKILMVALVPGGAAAAGWHYLPYTLTQAVSWRPAKATLGEGGGQARDI